MSKVVIVGEHGSGKTKSIMNVLLYPIHDKIAPTQGVAIHDYNNLKLWDTGGKYVGLAQSYYIGGDYFIIFCNYNIDEVIFYTEEITMLYPNTCIIYVDPNNITKSLYIGNECVRTRNLKAALDIIEDRIV